MALPWFGRLSLTTATGPLTSASNSSVGAALSAFAFYPDLDQRVWLFRGTGASTVLAAARWNPRRSSETGLALLMV